MTVLPQPTADLFLLATLVDGMKIAMLTTTRASGSLHSRPMAPVQFDEEGALWFFVDSRTERAESMGAANVAFTHEASAIYVSMAGNIERVDDPALVGSLWTPFARPWFAEGPKSLHISLLRFVPESAEYWDAPGSRVVRLVALSGSHTVDSRISVAEETSVSRRLPNKLPPAVERARVQGLNA